MNLFRNQGFLIGLLILNIFLSSCNNCNAVNSEVVSAYDLTVGEGFVNPIGFYDPSPVFSWKLPVADGITGQNAYHIKAASTPNLLKTNPDLWDTGKIQSDQSVWVPYAGKPLGSRQEVYWSVMFWDQDGKVSDWSSPARFELGLLENTDWKGQWMKLAEKDVDSSSNVKIEILKAAYGAPNDPAKQINMTKKLEKLIKQKSYNITVGNDLAGNDPAYGTPKFLFLQYKINGQLKTIKVKEGDKFSFTGKPSVEKKQYAPQYFRKEFAIDSKVKKARLFVTAKGLYEVSIDGSKVGDDFMAPGWTPYHKRIETLCYDVTKQIQQGRHCVGAVLGEGWYAGEMMRKKYVYPQAQPYLLFQLELEYTDGQTTMVVSDNSWKTTNNGPIRCSEIYDGETYDAQLEIDGWNRVGFDDHSWQSVTVDSIESDVKLVPKRHYPVQISQAVKTVRVSEPETGKFVFDLGQNIVGWPILNIPVRAGQTITVRFAEMCHKDGTLYTKNYRSAKSTDYYTAAKNGTITWHPTFTFHGFRYVELSGFPEGTKPSSDWVTGTVLHSGFKQTGHFDSSHAKLNQLQSNITWGQRGNFLDIPTDCPQRNERLGWTGDAQVFCPTSMFNYDVHSFWASWLWSVRQEQKSDGLIPFVVPSTMAGAGSPGWGDACVTIPWDVYVQTGDIALLADNYETMKKWTAAYHRQAKGYIVNRKGFGDWLQPYPQNKNNRADTPMDLIATAYFGRCVKIMADSANILGYQADAKTYRELHANIRKAFSRQYFDANGKLKVIDTQTAYLMALTYDLLEPQLVQKATVNLYKSFLAADRHLRTGFLGTPLIAPMFDKLGRSDVSYELLFKETYPSWFYSINQGATTMWERWNSYSHKDGFGNAGMNSFNHYAYGAIGQWMYERVAGLTPDPKQPGYKHFFIQPIPCDQLTHAEAILETPYGTAKSRWEKGNGKLQMTATVPPNTTATVIVPHIGQSKPIVTQNGQSVVLDSKDNQWQIDIQSGSYTFTVQ